MTLCNEIAYELKMVANFIFLVRHKGQIYMPSSVSVDYMLETISLIYFLRSSQNYFIFDTKGIDWNQNSICKASWNWLAKNQYILIKLCHN